MKNVVLLLFVLSTIVVTRPNALRADNVGECGVGSKLFAGQRGIAPQIFALTTNGTFGNTFAISSGTSGCTQDGVVKSSWVTAAFIDSNTTKLARDMSRGQGEALDSLAMLLDVSESDKAVFDQTLKENFDQVFTAEDVTTDTIRQNLVVVLSSSESLARYSARV